MKRVIYFLAAFAFLFSCKEDDSAKGARLYALDDIQGDYETISLTWEGEHPIDLDGDGNCSYDLFAELSGIDQNVNPAGVKSHVNTDSWQTDETFDGNLSLVFPREDIIQQDNGTIEVKAINKTPIDILFKMQRVGLFKFEHFDFIGKVYGDVSKPDWGNRIGMATFGDGDVILCENGFISFFRIKRYLVYDLSTHSLVTGAASIVIKKISV